MKVRLLLAVLLSICIQGSVEAQSKLKGGLEADFVSSYIWRGLHLGHFSFQPELSIGWKGLSLSAWGSVGLTNHKDDNIEIDLTLSYKTDGLSFGIIDYWDNGHDKRYFYYKTKEHTDRQKGEGTGHSFEAYVSYDFGPLSVSWQTFFAGNDFHEADGKRAFSSYFQLMAPFLRVTCDWEVAIGLVPWASDYYSADGLCVNNLSLKATKDIKITDSFSLPLFAQIVVNPASQKMYFSAGFTLKAL